jgi:hypothetical protein
LFSVVEFRRATGERVALRSAPRAAPLRPPSGPA